MRRAKRGLPKHQGSPNQGLLSNLRFFQSMCRALSSECGTMPSLQITFCMPDRSDPDRVIDCVGGRGWVMHMDVAILCAQQGMDFYVVVDGARAEVGVATSQYGRKYLRTRPDATIANNLGEITSRRIPVERLPQIPPRLPVAAASRRGFSALGGLHPDHGKPTLSLRPPGETPVGGFAAIARLTGHRSPDHGKPTLPLRPPGETPVGGFAAIAGLTDRRKA